MKKTLLLIFMAAIFGACSNSVDKKAQLDKLRKERDKLNEQIASLEKELDGKSSAASDKTKTIAVTPMVEQDFNHYIEVQAKIDGEDNVIASAKVPGTINNILVKEGDVVKKGQVLAILDASVLNQTLQEMKTSLDFITDLYNKQKSLWEQHIGTEVQYLTAKNNKESLENKIKTMGEQLDMYKITAPINGTIEEIPVKVGMPTSPGLVAFRVVNFSRVKVVADVAEGYSAKIKTGNDVLVKIPDLNTEINAKVTFASKFINPLNRTFQVEARLNPDNLGFRANMIAVIKINDYNVTKAMVAPVNVVQTIDNESFVYVAIDKAGKVVATKKVVTLGTTYNGQIEIKTGLAVGDKLITTGYQDLVDGQVIKL